MPHPVCPFSFLEGIMKEFRYDHSGVPSADVNQSGLSTPTKNKMRASSVTRGTTGPRTPTGKLRSKRNAIKHGIFSSVALLDSESISEFDSLLEDLVDYYRPVGRAEELDVEILAVHHWRWRRFLISEVAEIHRGIQFPFDDASDKSGQMITINVITEGKKRQNLMQSVADPEIREKCLGLLSDLKAGIEHSGFNASRDNELLTELYGSYENCNKKQPTIFGSYRKWLSNANCTEEERSKNQLASPEQSRKNFLADLEEEIRDLNRSQSISRKRTRLEQLRRYIPNSSVPEYLVRYDVSIQRSIDRTQCRLERHQRMRLDHSARRQST
jgi:hypothetical protein